MNALGGSGARLRLLVIACALGALIVASAATRPGFAAGSGPVAVAAKSGCKKLEGKKRLRDCRERNRRRKLAAKLGGSNLIDVRGPGASAMAPTTTERYAFCVDGSYLYENIARFSPFPMQTAAAYIDSFNGTWKVADAHFKGSLATGLVDITRQNFTSVIVSPTGERTPHGNPAPDPRTRMKITLEGTDGATIYFEGPNERPAPTSYNRSDLNACVTTPYSPPSVSGLAARPKGGQSSTSAAVTKPRSRQPVAEAQLWRFAGSSEG
jgi:hypothetical protein